MGVGRPTKYKPEYGDEALELVGRRGKSVAWLARHYEVNRSTIYQWAKDNPAFSDALSRAQEWSEATWEDRVEDMMMSRDVNAPLVKLYLAHRFGWSDKQTTEVTGAGGAALEVTVTRRVVDGGG